MIRLRPGRAFPSGLMTCLIILTGTQCHRFSYAHLPASGICHHTACPSDGGRGSLLTLVGHPYGKGNPKAPGQVGDHQDDVVCPLASVMICFMWAQHHGGDFVVRLAYLCRLSMLQMAQSSGGGPLTKSFDDSGIRPSAANFVPICTCCCAQSPVLPLLAALMHFPQVLPCKCGYVGCRTGCPPIFTCGHSIIATCLQQRAACCSLCRQPASTPESRVLQRFLCWYLCCN